MIPSLDSITAARSLEFFSFPSLRRFYHASKSTRWPGASRFAVHLLTFLFLVAVTQLTISWVRIGQLFEIKSEYECSVRGKPYLQSLPVTFVTKGPVHTAQWTFLSMTGNGNRAFSTPAIFFSISSPLSIIFILYCLIYMHVYRVLSNRTAILLALVLLGLFVASSVLRLHLDVGTTESVAGYPWCWVSRREMRVLHYERTKRRTLFVTDQLLCAVGMACTLVYLLLTALAAHRNNCSDGATQLHSLPSTQSTSRTLAATTTTTTTTNNNDNDNDNDNNINSASVASITSIATHQSDSAVPCDHHVAQVGVVAFPRPLLLVNHNNNNNNKVVSKGSKGSKDASAVARPRDVESRQTRGVNGSNPYVDWLDQERVLYSRVV